MSCIKVSVNVSSEVHQVLLGHLIPKAAAERDCQRAEVLSVRSQQCTEPNGSQGQGSGWE